MPAHAYDDASFPAGAQVRARAKALTPPDGAPALLLASVLHAAGVSARQLAPLSGVSGTRVTRWLDPGDKAAPNLRHIVRWPAGVRAALAAELATTTRPAVCLVRGALTAGREGGEAHGAVLEALADEELTLTEARRVAREAWEAVAAYRALALRAEVEAARLKEER